MNHKALSYSNEQFIPECFDLIFMTHNYKRVHTRVYVCTVHMYMNVHKH